VIVSGTEDLVNLGACVTLAEPCNAACGEAVQADRLCSFAACDPTQGPCLVTSTASLAAFNACESEADTTCGACSGFGNAATQCLDALVADSSKHAAATLCGLGSSDFNSRYTAVASFLCGP
jgi:malic enzyme